MQSRWVDRDAKATVDRYATIGVAPDLALRVYTTRLLGGDPAARAARRRQHLGEDHACATSSATRSRCCASRAPAPDMATIEPAGLPAVRLAPLRKLRARDDAVRRRTWCASSAPICSIPTAPNPSVETAAARLPAAQIRRPHPCDRGAEPDRPAGRRRARATRSMTAASASCPTSCRASGSPRPRPRCSTRNPQVEGLILDKHGIFTFGASAREAYERMIEMVTRAEERLRKNRKAVFVTAQMPQQVAPRARGRADRARRLQPARTTAARARIAG